VPHRLEYRTPDPPGPGPRRVPVGHRLGFWAVYAAFAYAGLYVLMMVLRGDGGTLCLAVGSIGLTTVVVLGERRRIRPIWLPAQLLISAAVGAASSLWVYLFYLFMHLFRHL
jgi:hypothetical protein